MLHILLTVPAVYPMMIDDSPPLPQDGLVSVCAYLQQTHGVQH